MEIYSSESEESDVEDKDRDPSLPQDNQALMEKQKELMKNPQEVANLIYRKVIDAQGKITETDLRMLKGLSRSWVLEQDPYKQVPTTDSVAVGERTVSAAAHETVS